MRTLVAIPPAASRLESVPCLGCGSDVADSFMAARDDFTGRPGRFHFVRCGPCGLVYQTPRIEVQHIKAWYDDDYIAHRGRADWGVMGRFHQAAVASLDRRKERIVSRYVTLGPGSEVLDVGCGVGSFLLRLEARYNVRAVGVDFKDFSGHPGFERIDFHCGLFYEQDLGRDRFDLVTMWHFLEHDYEPRRSLALAREVVKPEGRVVIEVPRLDSLSFRLFTDRWPGVQAPQHTALYDRRALLRLVTDAGFRVLDYLPWGAFPAYFYLFAGIAFQLLRGRGLNPRRAIYPYFVGQCLTAPLFLLTEQRWNWAMQTVVCGRAT